MFIHPTLQRFRENFKHETSLLFITAASGTERNLFARSWLGGQPGEIIDLSAPQINLRQELNQLNERVTSDPKLRRVVFVSPAESAWLLASRFDCLVARQSDLLLTQTELQETLGTDAEITAKIYEQTGGWLSASLRMKNSPAETFTAYRIIRTALTRWLAAHPHAEAIRQASFLPVIDETSTEVFYSELGNINFGLDELKDAGIVRKNPAGGWSMPRLIRRALVEQQRDIDDAAAQDLDILGLSIVAQTHGVQRAVEKAARKHNWKALDLLLNDRWVELFISNPRGLRQYLNQVPEFVMNQTNYLWVAARIVAAIGTDRMVLPFPTIPPNFESDRAAQRMHEQTTRLYRRPTQRALTAGLLEITYLRLAGLYSESADAATKLRATAHAVSGGHRVNLKLLAMLELHCGISLELEGRDVEAKWAYTEAYQQAQEDGSAFQIADATSRLALLCAKQKDPAAAHGWLEEHEAVIGQVSWGKAMVGRGAALARGCLALSELDFAEFERVLAQLPQEPDSDEFWAMHLALLAFQAALNGQVSAYGLLLQRLSEERIYALSDLSAEQLEQAHQILRLAGLWSEHEPTAENRAAEFRALAELRSGQFDRALRLLEEAKAKPISQRCAGLQMYLEIAARRKDPTTGSITELKNLYATQNRLLDLALLSTVPGWGSVGDSLGLDQESLRRIRVFQQAFPTPETVPELTEREVELLQFLREGLTRKQMATASFRSENTIKTQLRGLYRKLNAVDSSDALERARVLGI